MKTATKITHTFTKERGATLTPTPKGFTAVITSEVVDRDGEVLVPEGMDDREYMKNPLLLYMHDRAKPVGKCVSLRRMGTSIFGDFVWLERPSYVVGDWPPDIARGLVEAGGVNAVSVGGVAKEGGYRSATKGDTQKYGPSCVAVMSKWSLYEVSLVTIPANQDALITSVRKQRGVAAKPAPVPVTRHTIKVVVPAIGTEDVAKVVREEFARARGALYAND